MRIAKFRKHRDSTRAHDLGILYNHPLCRYKIGDSFFTLALPEVQELVTGSTTKIEEDVEKLEGKLNGLREEMQELKVALYARFGRSINLET
jgi:prefoldin subunit 4